MISTLLGNTNPNTSTYQRNSTACPAIDYLAGGPGGPSEDAIREAEELNRSARQSLFALPQNVPEELRERPHWCVWRYEPNEDGGKPRKIPYDAKLDQKASSTDPGTWSSFREAYSVACEYESLAGLMFALSSDDPYAGIDLDGVVDRETGELEPDARETVDRLSSYTEISVSGGGLHILVKGALPGGRGRRSGKVELYSQERFFVVTGNHVDETPPGIVDRREELHDLFNDVFGATSQACRIGKDPNELPPLDENDAEIVELAKRSRTGQKFSLLWKGQWEEAGYPSHSEADAALCSMLNSRVRGDTVRIDRLFRASGLMREKWNRKDYREGVFALINSGKSQVRRPHAMTDMGNSERLVAQYGDDIRFCAPQGQWFIYNSRRWAPDVTGQVQAFAKETVRTIRQEVSSVTSEGDDSHAEGLRRRIRHHAQKSESLRAVKAMVELTKSDPSVVVRSEDLDADPLLLNVENGTLDLRTGELRAHRRADLLTKVAAVMFDPKAKCPTFDRFIWKILGGDKGLIAYMYRALGYNLTGLTVEQVLFLLIGLGNNGKTTLMEINAQLCGDYAQKAPASLFADSRGRSTGSGSDVARLRGARLVVSSETEEDCRLPEGLIKDLTGGDTITARFLYREFFQFQPTHKLWIYANRYPTIRGTDCGIWRRIHLIPFDVSIPEAEIDRHLLAKLEQEKSGILNRLIEGLADWRAQGLAPPQRVRLATEQYRETLDNVGQFLADRAELVPNGWTSTHDLKNAYGCWCGNSGTEPCSPSALWQRLRDRGLAPGKSAGQRGWKGVNLKGR